MLWDAEGSAAEVLHTHHVKVDVKCSEGLCGVCKCGLVRGDVEHLDFVLSQSQWKTAIILCQSLAATPGGVVEVEL
ncbi:MAG: 2Fe-2S iron-sulfur cluster-binding protein [Pseudomonadota bacterium]